MTQTIMQHLWRQFGATIDMFYNALAACPDELLRSNQWFFLTVYHNLFFLDYYLTNPPSDFAPLLPLDRENDIPARQYTKEELLNYTRICREKCRTVIQGLSTNMNERWIEDGSNGRPRDYALIELLMYNMRHVQHHTGQLNLILRKETNYAPDWVPYAKDDLY